MERLKAAVIDTSVVLKWFRPDEPYSSTALVIRRAYLEETLELVMPDLALYEAANVLRHRASETMAVQAVESLFDLRLPIHRLDRQGLQNALRVSFRYQITVYDAVFLSVAQGLHLQLVTADRQFYQAIHQLPGIFFLQNLKV